MIPHFVLLSSVAAIAPLMILLWLDRHEREPLGRICGLYVAAIVATAVFAFVKGHILAGVKLEPFFEAYVVAALLEETVKFGLLAWVIHRWRSTYDEMFDAIVYLGVIALGFAMFENIGYYLVHTQEGRIRMATMGDPSLYRHQFLEIGIARLLPGHLLFAFVSGLVAGRGVLAGRPAAYVFRALPLAVAIHGTWNYLSTTHDAWFGPFLTLLIAAAVWATLVARTASPYRKAQARWGAVVRRALRVAAAGVPASRAEFVHLVRTLQPMMMTLRRQPGSLQNEVYALLSRAFRPDTPEAEAEQSLARAIRFLQTHPAVVTDWSYVALLGIVLLVLGAGTSTVCLFLMWGVG